MSPASKTVLRTPWSYSAVNGHTAIVLSINRPTQEQNIVSTIDAIKQLLPRLQSQMPPSVKMQFAQRSFPVNSPGDSMTLTSPLLLTIALVYPGYPVVLRNLRATLIPALRRAGFTRSVPLRC